MSEIKNIVGTVAVILVFIGYVPYIRDILKGKTIPHVYSWFVWGFTTLIVFALQHSDKAGIGAFVTLSAAAMCIVVFILGFIRHGTKDIVFLDTIFLVGSFVALLLWMLAKQPV